MQKQVLNMTLTAKLNALNFDLNLPLIYINGNTLESLNSQSYFSTILRVSRTIFIYILNELFYTVYFLNFIIQLYKQTHVRLFYPIEEYRPSSPFIGGKYRESEFDQYKKLINKLKQLMLI